MKIIIRRIPRIALCICVCCLGIMSLAGCTGFLSSQVPYPGAGGQGGTIAPTLSNLAVSPNPASSGTIVNLTVTYTDPDADLHFGIAAVSVDGGKLSRIAFRSTYQSGILRIPLAISHYSRPSNAAIVLKIRDSAGNWSNAVSTVLSIR